MEPLSAFFQDTENGYDGIVYANLYANFVKPGEKTYSDIKGTKWELRVSIYSCFSKGTWLGNY